MSKAMKSTLLAIAAVIGGIAGSFICFVANWDKEAEEPIVFQSETAEVVA